YFLPRATAAVGHAQWQVRVMSLNVEASNDRADLVTAAIGRANPDVIVMPEATAAWAEALAPLRARYPYGAGEGGNGPFSLLLLSRLPLRDAQVVQLSNYGWPTIVARVCPAETAEEKNCIGLVGIHPPPPMSEDLAAKRNAVFRALPDAL